MDDLKALAIESYKQDIAKVEAERRKQDEERAAQDKVKANAKINDFLRHVGLPESVHGCFQIDATHFLRDGQLYDLCVDTHCPRCMQICNSTNVKTLSDIGMVLVTTDVYCPMCSPPISAPVPPLIPAERLMSALRDIIADAVAGTQAEIVAEFEMRQDKATERIRLLESELDNVTYERCRSDDRVRELEDRLKEKR